MAPLKSRKAQGFHEIRAAVCHCAETGLLHEWLQGTYLAVSLASGIDPAPLAAALETPAEAGALHWETDSRATAHFDRTSQSLRQ
ncbi:hypothetical protein ACWCRC_42080, partial [Streptomyces sp. NPDC001940]